MSSYPIQTKKTLQHGDLMTEIICTTYNDRHFVVISQMKKFGTLINAWSDIKADGTKSFDMTTLLGRYFISRVFFVLFFLCFSS